MKLDIFFFSYFFSFSSKKRWRSDSMNIEQFKQTITHVQFNDAGRVTALSGRCKASDFRRASGCQCDRCAEIEQRFNDELEQRDHYERDNSD